MQNSTRQGRCLCLTPDEDVAGGQLVTVGGIVAVASTDIPAGQTGACEVEGVFELPKDNAAIMQGAATCLTEDGRVSAAAGKTFVGACWQDAAAGDATALVRINFGASAAGAAQAGA